MDSKCLLCCKRSGEYCRTNYFHQLVFKHLSINVEGRLCICESCGQLLRHWDDFSAEAQANLSRKTIVEADSGSDAFAEKSCDQETQTDFGDHQSHLSEHSYAKTLPEATQDNWFCPPDRDFCPVDSSSRTLSDDDGYSSLHKSSQDFNSSFYESPDSGIKILDVCELKDEQWFDEPNEKLEGWDPNVRVKDEPMDYEEMEDTASNSPQKYEAVDQGTQHFDCKPVDLDFKPKFENQLLEDCLLFTEVDEKMKLEGSDDRKPMVAPPPVINLPSVASMSFACPLCDKQFPENDLLVLHLRSHENFFKPALHLKCPDCNQEFQSEHILVEHIMEYHPTNESGQVCCVICNQVKINRMELKKHIIGCHFCTTPAMGTRSVFDSTSGPEEETDEIIKPSAKIVQKTTFSCKLCNIKLSSRLKLKLHVENRHKGKKIVMKKASEEDKNVSAKKLALQKTVEPVAKKLHFERNKRFYCKICMKSFPSARGAACHITMIHKQRYDLPSKESAGKKGSFPCKKCKKVFSSLVWLNNHVCQILELVKQSSMKLHSYSKIYTRSEKGQYSCKLCPTQVQSYSGIVKHIKRYHSPSSKTTPVKVDPKPAAEEAVVKKEPAEVLKKQDVKKVEQELPPRDLVYVKMKRRPQFYACEDCNRRFLKTKQLRIHRKRLCCKISRSNQMPIQLYFMQRDDHFLCNFCFKTESYFKFKRAEDVKFHLQEDHNLMVEANSELMYVCKYCSQNYKGPSYLKLHIKQKHLAADDAKEEEVKIKTEEEKPVKLGTSSPGRLYPCKHCSKKLPLRIALQKHMMLKHSDKMPTPPPLIKVKTEPIDPDTLVPESAPISPAPENKNVCKICNKSFKFSIALTKHIASHTEAQNSSPQNLQPAVQIAPPVIPTLPVVPTVQPAQAAQTSEMLKCQVCGKVFGDKDQLQAHGQTHAAAKEAEKKVASQTFVSAKQLTCDLCDKGLFFFSQIALDRHKRKCHNVT